MTVFSNTNFTKQSYFNLVFGLFPLSFIAGNMIVNFNLMLLIISAILIFKNKIFKIEFFTLDKFVLSFFFVVLFSGVLSDIDLYDTKRTFKGVFSSTIKSIFFFRFLLLYFVLRYLIEKKELNLRIFFILSTFAVFFVSIDIIFQYFYGKDIFGYVKDGRKLSGPFGDELIAGSFIQRFSLFSFFIIPIFFNKINSNKFFKYLIPIIFIIFFSSLILSGNRMPTIMFLFSIFLIILFQKQTRKFLVPFVIIFLIIAYTLFKSNENVRNNFYNFYEQISVTSELIIKKDFFNKNSPPYLKEFSSFYHTWLLNKYIGGGIKNFRYYCHARPFIQKDSKFICNMHPHNYYLEILTDTGVVGFLLIFISFSIIFYMSFFKKYFLKSKLKKNTILIPFIFTFIAELFPLKSTGSFFTTGNATFIFLILAILVGIVRSENSIENKI